MTDKATIIAKIAQEPEDRLLLARILDKYEQMERRNAPAATGFLSPREAAMAEALLHTAGVRTGFRFDGGYEGAERTILQFLPDWAEGGEAELVFLRASFRDPMASLTHRDLLGSLMALGVERNRVGDILVSPHSADIVAAPSLRDFFLREWESAGRTRLTVTEIGRADLLVPAAQVKVIRDTAASLRLDTVTAAAFSLSRGEAAEQIAAGRLSVNHLPCRKGDRLLSPGDLLSLRGGGRARLAEVGGPTRKGRLSIVIERYL